jgi:hypothetical protein
MNSQQENLFWGYRPLITHNRKRNTIRAVELEHSLRWLAGERSHPGNGAPKPSQSPMTAVSTAQRDQKALSKAKIDALIERFKPITVSQDRGRLHAWRE